MPLYHYFILFFHVICTIMLFLYISDNYYTFRPSLALCLPLAILKPLEECARAQSISQHVDAGQLNVPP